MLTSQDMANVLVRYCGPRFFTLPLPGATMLMLDFIHAANNIASTTDLKEVNISNVSAAVWFYHKGSYKLGSFRVWINFSRFDNELVLKVHSRWCKFLVICDGKKNFSTLLLVDFLKSHNLEMKCKNLVSLNKIVIVKMLAVIQHI